MFLLLRRLPIVTDLLSAPAPFSSKAGKVEFEEMGVAPGERNAHAARFIAMTRLED
jgi:hypothetical protein